MADVGQGNSGQVLQSNGSGISPTFSTATYPVTAGTSGNVLTSNGTNFTSTTLPTTVKQHYTATAINYQVLITDAIIGVTNTSSTRTITMPNGGLVAGQRWTITDESGGAASHNITISGNGNNINGAATFVMNTNNGSVDIYYNGLNFFIC